MITSKDIVEAIFNIDEKAQFLLKETQIENIEWFTKPISVEDIENEIAELPQKRLAKEAEAIAKKAELLAKLGITEEEAKLLLS